MTLGFINFGGPAGQIAVMHRELVERRSWIEERAFMRGLNLCMLLPGPEAQQLATYVGWRLHGLRGALAAGAFFVIPSVFVLLLLAWVVAAYGDVPLVSALLYGVQPVVVALVLDALIRIGRRTLRHPALGVFAVVAYVALQVFAVPFPLVVAAAGAAGALLRTRIPAAFEHEAGHAAPMIPPPEPAAAVPVRPASLFRRAALVVAIFALLWAVPVGALLLWRGGDDVLVREALFFTQAALVTFGGAYAVLAYIADAAVHQFAWLTSDQMVQGLGLAESTPGPLIMVTQYVGFLGAWKLHPEAPLLNGILGGLITTYVTFLPSFLFILVAGPYVDRLATEGPVSAALVGVTAAVVGVIARLGTFFATSVLFEGGAIDGFAVAVAIGAFAVLRRTRVPVPALVVAGAVLGMAWRSRPF